MNNNTSHHRYTSDQQLINAVPVSIYLKDLQGVYLNCNQYMVNMAGLQSRDQIIGKSDYQLPWNKQADKIRAIDQAVIQDDKEFCIEEQPEIYRGHFKTFLSTKSPFRDSQNQIIGIVGVSIDITKQKQLQKTLELTEQSLEKSLTIKERFLRNINHETRNPLQALIVIAEVLSQNWSKFDDSKRKELIDSVALSSRRLSTFVTNTFDLSELIKQDQNLNIGRYDLSELIATIVADFNEAAKLDQQAQIIFNYSAEYYLAFDQEKITQVLHNILMNSLKWTQAEGSITVELSKTTFPRSTEVGIQCSIKDTGIGIPEAELDFIFEPFSESSKTASEACGTGLGLALCREIIKSHNGEIWSSNNADGGAVISFILPNSTILGNGPGSKDDDLDNSRDVSSVNVITPLQTQPPCQFKAINDKSKIILAKKEFALVGVSPFNSYFTTEQITSIIQLVAQSFTDFKIFMPNKLSEYTLRALGYSQPRLKEKLRKQDNYLKNKVIKALASVNPAYVSTDKIVTFSELLKNDCYTELYNMCVTRFENDQEFRQGCLETSRWVLAAVSVGDSRDTKDSPVITDMNAAVQIAVQYFLKELPIFLDSPKILGVSSCTFLYHSVPKFLKEIYSIDDDSSLVSKNQGFAELHWT